MNFGMHMII